MGGGREQECWLKGEEAPVPGGHPGTASRHTPHTQARSQAGQIVLVLRAATGVGTRTRTGLGEDGLCAATFVLGPQVSSCFQGSSHIRLAVHWAHHPMGMLLEPAAHWLPGPLSQSLSPGQPLPQQQ